MLMRLLIQFPTRSRPSKSLETAAKYAAMSSGLHDIMLHFALDDDDPTVTANFIAGCKRITGGIVGIVGKGEWKTVTKIGTHRGKVAAVNDIPKDGWDVCLVASDDMIPAEDGYDDVIAKKMTAVYPHLDGSLWFNDGYVGEALNTIICVGKKYYDRFGYLYHPTYESMWADNEFTEVGTMLGRQKYFEQVIIRHEHPNNNHDVRKDDLYVRNDEPWKRDHKKYLARKAHRFDVRLLDILICTLPDRRHKFDRVYGNIMNQVKTGSYETNVHVIYDDTKEISIGAKRNRLMNESSAEYVCYVDDDDDVSQDYVRSLLAGIGNCEVDAVAMRGSMMVGGGSWKRFEHDLKHNMYTSNPDGTMYYRPPNHLNPIRRSIAIRYPFVDESHGEDTDYAMRIQKDGAIKTCKMPVEHPIYYYIPSSLQNAAEVPSTDGAASSQKNSGPHPAIPDNMNSSTWRYEGPRRPRG